MDILFGDDDLQQVCNQFHLAQRKFGKPRAKRLLDRLSQLKAAATLEDFAKLGIGHPHELKGNLAGKLAVAVDQQFRMVFEPAHHPVPKKPDGGLDWPRVTAIRVVAVRDYHG
jgi:proteic killer suppression protein